MSRRDSAAWIAAAAVGALATAILVVNNLRDRVTDARVGKNTLAVKLGPELTRIEYVLLLAAGFALPVVIGRPWVLLALPLAIPPLRRVMRQDGAELNPALGETGRIALAISVLMWI